MYSYDGTYGDRLSVIQSDSEESQQIAYNALGNPLSYRGDTLEWQNGTQLANFGDSSFRYDGYGKRVKKGNIVYGYDAAGKLVKQSDGENTLEFIYDESGISGVKHNGTDYVYRKNVQGDITHVFDKNGGLVSSYAYDAWGNHKIYQNGIIDDVHLLYDSIQGIIDGYQKSHIGNLNPFRYRSYLYDDETGLFYLKTRYYDPETGRFISQDEVGYLNPEQVNGLNLYAYCACNPVMRIDPNGNAWWHWLIGIVIIAVLAVATVVTCGLAVTALGVATLGGSVAALSGLITATAVLAVATTTAIVVGISGLIFGGLDTSGDTLSWNWDKAAEGFMWGVIGGAVSGATSVLTCGLPVLAQIAIGATVAFGMEAVEGVVTGNFSWRKCIMAAVFGAAGSIPGIPFIVSNYVFPIIEDATNFVIDNGAAIGELFIRGFKDLYMLLDRKRSFAPGRRFAAPV